MGAAKIMIVEDEFVVARDLQFSLETLGYDVCGAVDNAESALSTAMNERPDLVLMDIILKGSRDGIDAAQDLHDRLSIPVVFLTANANESLIERAKQTEPYGYLIKPFLDRELRTTIEMALFKSQRDQERLAAALGEDGRPVRVGSLEVVPICGHCKKIKNKDERWEVLEDYLHRRYGIVLSHGLCPECAKKLYPDIF
jgi:CheY-like chemotaxis protein